MIRIKKLLAMIIVVVMVFSSIFNNVVYASNSFNLNIDSVTSGSGRSDLSMSWNEVKFSGKSTRYSLARLNTRTGIWELRGNYSLEKVRVLNVYPDVSGSDGLKSWMNVLNNSNDKVNIEVTAVSISEFNSRPDTYLKKDTLNPDLYNYDVIVFGFWDSNNNRDLGTSASQLVQKFIDNGGGVIFGHDTVQHLGRQSVFTSLVENNLSVKIMERDKTKWVYSDKIKVKKQGSVTTYPFDITGKDLVIPLSHTVNQVPTNPDSVYMSFVKNYYPSPGDGPYYSYNVNSSAKEDQYATVNGVSYDVNSYLMVEGNTALIQTGHTMGKTNEAERMVLANLIYAMAQTNVELNTIDQILDANAPTKPTYSITNNESISFASTDQGDTYKYRVIATPMDKSITSEWDNITKVLGNSNITSYGNDVKFSDIESVNVVGGLKNFIYTIDNNPNTELQDGNTLGINGKINIPTPFTGLTNDQYIHFAAVDLGGNISETSTYLIWDIVPKVPVNIHYKNKEGQTIDPSVTSNEMIGATFSIPTKKIDGYEFVEAQPSQSIVIKANVDNSITFVYNEILTKEFYLAEYRTIPTSTVTINSEKKTISYPKGSILTTVVPVYKNYIFKGFYTTGTATDNGTNKVSVSGTTANIPFLNNDKIFVHYDRKVATAKVSVVRSDDNSVVLGELTKTAHVGDVATILGSEIASIDIDDIDCYTNASLIIETKNITLTGNSVDDTIIIELEPRVKTINYLGIDYNDNEKISDLGSKQVTYGTEKVVDVPKDSFAGWTLNEGQENLTMDFSKQSSVVNVGYYKGVPTNRAYDYSVDYLNFIDKEQLEPTLNEPSMDITTQKDLEFPSVKGIYIDEAERNVDFTVAQIVITPPENTSGSAVTLTYNFDEYLNYLPMVGTDGKYISGHYDIDIMYIPTVEVTYKEYVLDQEDVAQLTDTIKFQTLMALPGKPKQYYSTLPLENYNIVEVKLNDVEQPNPENFDFKIETLNYNEHVDVTYDEKDYNLTIIAESLSSDIS
ncbi:MAG: MucBP domain-containing protein, partial [Lachnospirales bacterium]